MARKYGQKASQKVQRAIKEMKSGDLKSGRSGKRVTNRKQAIAIGLSEARKEGGKVPPESGSKSSGKSTSRRKSSARKSTASRSSTTVSKSSPRRSTTRSGASKTGSSSRSSKKGSSSNRRRSTRASS